MQVVILAGGEGTRLRPLTYDIPKPLVRILGTPVIERLTALLFRSGFRSATVADYYLADKLESELGDFSNGIKINYVTEDIPLGTAGCVRKAWQGDDVLVVSGDSVCEFDFKAICGFHQKMSADVTIVTHKVADPREYGLVTADENGRVIGFLEKPGYDMCLTDVANTGAYVISKDVMSRIPKDEKTDFASDIFPQLLKEDKRIFSYAEEGIWHDIGDIPSFLNCQSELLDAESQTCLVFPDASVKDSAIIGSGSVIEGGASVGADCRVQRSLISAGASLGDGCTLNLAIIADNVTVGRGAVFGEYCAVGKDCVIGSAVTVDPGVRIAPRTRIPSGAHIRSDISHGGYKPLSIGDFGEAEGILLDSVASLRFGMAVAEALNLSEITVGIASDISPIAEAVCLGLRSAGAKVYYLSFATFGETVFAARKVKTKYCIYVSDGVRLIRSDRIELARSEERRVEQTFNRGELKDRGCAPLINADAVSSLYKSELAASFPERSGSRVTVKTDLECEAERFAEAASESDFSVGESIEFIIASDRMSVTCVLKDKNISYETLILLACRSYFSKRLSVRLQQRAPMSCDDYASREGMSVTHVTASDDLELSMFAYDPLMLIAEVLSYISKRCISLSAAASELPDIVYTRRTLNVSQGLPKLLSEDFCDLRRGNDIVLETDAARAYVRPLKSGKALSVYVESVSAEAAGSICDDILKRIAADTDD